MEEVKVKTWNGGSVSCMLPEKGDDLLALPASIDPHVHFRTPGKEYKEDWYTGAKAAFAGGVTRVFDMPNHNPNCVSYKHLQEKKKVIAGQLEELGFPMDYGLYLGADREFFDEIGPCSQEVVALKVFMGSSTGTLLVDDDASLDRAFCEAGKHQMIVAVHAEDEATIRKNVELAPFAEDPRHHSQVRTPEAAALAVERALFFAKKHGVRLSVLHVSTEEELACIRRAKAQGQEVLAEATPHHLFFTTAAYDSLGTYALVNPPLREEKQREALWEAVLDGTIDVVGSDHAVYDASSKRAC